MIRHGLEKVAERAVNYALEYVTEIVMNDDGTIDASGAGDRPVTTEVGPRFGFYSRTKDGAVGVVLRFAGLSFLVAYADAQFSMSLQKGEVGLQNAFGANILLDKNGIVNINGTDYALIKDTLLSDLSTALGYIPTAASTPYPGLVPNVTQWAAFLTKLGDGTYKSIKGKFG